MTRTSDAGRHRDPDAGTRGGRRARWLGAGGLGVAAVGVVVQSVARGGTEMRLGLAAVLAVMAVLTAVVRSRWILLVSGLAAVLALLNVVDLRGSGALAGRAGLGVALGSWILLAGAATAAWCSVSGLVRGMRGSRRTDASTVARTSGDWRRRAQIVALLVLAPVCAEYLSAYDDSTGDAVRLVGGLIIFVPLYGAPALLIREFGRRAGMGWPGMLLLGAAFGVVQAGLVDQSLFSLDYRGIESWDAGLRGTFLTPLGTSAYNVVNFVGGHMIYSICAPIAIVEAFRPTRRQRPWLGPWGTAIAAVAYAGASALVLVDSLRTENSHASAGQLVGSAITVALLVGAAIALRRRRVAPSDRPAPRAWTVFAVLMVVALVYNLAPTSWIGVAVSVLALALAAGWLARSCRGTGWSARQVLAAGAAVVMTRAVLAFTYFPVIGDVSPLRKYGHNVFFLIALAVLCGWAWRTAGARNASTALRPSSGVAPT